MQLKDFDYHLPSTLVAQYPLPKRVSARLMILDRKAQTIRHDVFANIGRYLPANSVMILNDTKVIPARLFGQRESGGRVEIFLLEKVGAEGFFRCLIKPLRKIKENEDIFFPGTGLKARLIAKEEKHALVRFNRQRLHTYLERLGHVPLPPYIRRQDTKIDKTQYQTVYAKAPGSVAAPTAGLHFSKNLLEDLKKAGHEILKVTLHVNYATFNPVTEEKIEKHRMHFEDYHLPARVATAVKKAQASSRPVVAVGTTSCRALEAAAATGERSGRTDLFIYPGYAFRWVDVLLTNFHLPCSTLLILVCAFAGRNFVRRAYREAIKEKYRFFSYGDAMLVL